jgi:hypothetical protein
LQRKQLPQQLDLIIDAAAAASAAAAAAPDKRVQPAHPLAQIILLRPQ